LNFKYIFLLLIIFSSCGVKTRPKEPANTKLPTITDKYSYKKEVSKQSKEEQKKKKEEKKK